MLKKIAAWTAGLTGIILVIAFGVMGVKIVDGDYDIEMLAYICLFAWIGLMASIIVLRWHSWKCPHCGKPRWVNGPYCTYCGKKIAE